MALNQNIMALIAAFLFSLVLASMDAAHAAVLGTNLTSSAITSTADTAAPPHYSISSDTDPISILCNIPNFERSYLSTFDEVTNHLRNMPGNATLGNKPGGGWCSRNSCSWNLAIYACNDNQADTQVPWATMAEYADAIKDECTSKKYVHGHYKAVVQGQAFDAGGWNVILGIAAGTTC